jgi:hypothetical protein
LNKNCDDKVKIFLHEINHLLDEMRKLSKKEIEFKQKVSSSHLKGG